MRRFKEFEDIQNAFVDLALNLSMCQEEVPPEIFEPMADAFLKQYKHELDLFNVENDYKQHQRESKYRQRLSKRGWRRRIRQELKKNENDAVNEEAESEQSERINSEAVYAQPIDSRVEVEQSAGQIEADKSSICLPSPNTDNANQESLRGEA